MPASSLQSTAQAHRLDDPSLLCPLNFLVHPTLILLFFGYESLGHSWTPSPTLVKRERHISLVHDGGCIKSSSCLLPVEVKGKKPVLSHHASYLCDDDHGSPARSESC